MVKRFMIETTTLDQEFKFITESRASKLYFLSFEDEPTVKYSYMKGKAKQVKELDISLFVGIKGWKALGNKLGEHKILKVEDQSTAGVDIDAEYEIEEKSSKSETSKTKSSPKKAATSKGKGKSASKSKKGKSKDGDKLSPGDTIEFDF